MLGDGRVEDAARHFGNGLVFVGGLPDARHCRRSSHAKKVVGVELGAETPDEHRHVRALPPAICVQLVKDEELKPLAVLHHLTILRVAREDEVEHHVVRQKDVRRVLADSLAIFLALLTRVAADRDRLGPFGIVAEKLTHLLALAVCKRIHRIDDDGTSSGRRVRLLLLDDAVDDRDEEAERLARPRARRDHVALAMLDMGNRLSLMLVETERLLRESSNAVLHLLFEELENRGTFRSQHAGGGEFIDRLVLWLIWIRGSRQ